MKVFKLKPFVRLAKKEKISDAALRKAVERAEKGLIDGDLGGHVIKQRVGRRGSHRVLICYRKGDLAFFAYCFPKSKRERLR